MPPRKQRRWKHKGSSRRETSAVTVDLTLNYYANAEKPPAGTGRVRKGEKITSVAQVTMLATPHPTESDVSWFDKDVDDFDIESTGDQCEDEEGTGTKVVPPDQSTVVVDIGAEGGEYPLDFWLILSQYIYPEDINTFSRLCRSAHFAVKCASFWRTLYHRFYDDSVVLPVVLQRLNVERSRGLRARVARALHYMYPPFIKRCKTSEVFDDAPHRLEGLRCVMYWYEHLKNNVWRFIFKLSRKSTNGGSIQKRWESIDLINGYDDIYENSEDGCSVLQVTCQNFIQTPMVMGLVLNKLYLSVSQGMRYHKLRLVFDSQMKTVTKGCISGTEIILDPVTNLRVFQWWEPLYPYVTKTTR